MVQSVTQERLGRKSDCLETRYTEPAPDSTITLLADLEMTCDIALAQSHVSSTSGEQDYMNTTHLLERC